MGEYKFNFNKEPKNETYGKIRTGHSVGYGFFSKYGNDSAIYGIRCKVNGKVYVGSTTHLQRRLMKHFNELKFNRHRTKQLQLDYNAYGFNAFEIIVYSNNADDLLNAETLKQKEIGIDNLYNEKISGYWVTPELRKQYSNVNKNSHKTKEFREKMSAIKTNKVAQYDLDNNYIKTWNSAVEICNTLGYTRSVILSCCNGNKKRAYGYIWHYVNDDNEIITDGYAKARK